MLVRADSPSEPPVPMRLLEPLAERVPTRSEAVGVGPLVRRLPATMLLLIVSRLPSKTPPESYWAATRTRLPEMVLLVIVAVPEEALEI